MFGTDILPDSADNRPHISLNVLGQRINCLLDTGANVSIAGANGSEILKKLGIYLDTSYGNSVGTVDSTRHLVDGLFYVPVNYNGIFDIVTVMSVPTLPTGIIMGVNFFKSFNVILFHDDKGWSCDSIVESSKNRGVVGYSELTVYQKSDLDSIIEKFRGIGDGKFGRCRFMEHHILTGDALPIKQRGYPVSPMVQERFGKELKRMIDLGVIEPSLSPWSSPAVLVKKANGKDRLCVDSRKLNSVTIRDAYPLPRVSEILDRLGKSFYLSKIDLNDFFWQIPLSAESKEKTAFAVPGHGLYQFTRLPFGLHNAAQCAQRLMNVLFGETDQKIFVYLDDIIVATPSFDEHLEVLDFVYRRLLDAGLTINFDKSSFCLPSLKYLGHVVDGNGLRTDPDKVQAVLNYPRPTTFTELKRFIGLTSWYRRFVPNYATIAEPLHSLTRGKAKPSRLSWNSEADSAFLKLKKLLVSSPVLTTPDFSLPFSIHCDASNTGLGVVLCQGPSDSPIAYASRQLRGAELKYSVTEKECLAVVFALEKFRPYVEGYHFNIYTDHSSLTWLFNQENPPGRIARWVMKLSQYDFKIFHKKGSSNIVPDALSRANCQVDLIDFSVQGSDDWYIKMLAKVALSPNRFKDWRVVDDKLFYKFNQNTVVSDNDPWRLVIPESQRKNAIIDSHDVPFAGHMGVKRTTKKCLSRYYWPGLGLDVQKYVKSCEICNTAKQSSNKRAGLMGKPKIVTKPFQMISMDLLGPLPRSTKQNAYLLVITDRFTKYSSLFPIRQATASKIMDLVETRWFCIFGVPETIIMDNGKQFISKALKNLANKYAAKNLWYNAFYHPQNNPTERGNKVIGNVLRCYIKDNHRVWDKDIHQVEVALNTSISEVTGYTPFFLTFGRHFTYSPSDYQAYLNESTDPSKIIPNRLKFLENFNRLYTYISERLKKAHDTYKKYYDRNKSSLTFETGDIVYKRNYVQSDAVNYKSAKLYPKYVKCKVLTKISDVIYELEDSEGKNIGRWHIKDLKS